MPNPAFPFCRSLLAGDSARDPLAGVALRLQAGSYIRTKAPVIAAALLALLFAGCATTTTTPALGSAPTTPTAPAASVAQPPTPPPPPVVELPPARITGSEETSTMLDNFTVFVVAVDGVPVAAGRPGWNTPVPLKAGPRRVTLGFNRGVFAATTDIMLNATSAAAYQVRFATDAELFGKNSYCEFWIVDTATDQPACERVRATLTRIEPAPR